MRLPATCGVPMLDDEELQRVLRTVRYTHLSDDHFRHLVAFAQQHGLDLWDDDVWAGTQCREGGRNELVVGVKLQALRKLAARTGRHAGTSAPLWCGEDGRWREVWLPDGPPVAAKVIVTRSDGRRFGAVAKFKSFATYCGSGEDGQPVLSEFWAKMPDHMCAKVAESHALRKAFPEELRGLLTYEEMYGRPGGPTGPASAGRSRRTVTGATVDDSTPGGEMTFRLRLIRYFEMDHAQVLSTIARFEARYPGLHEADPPAFYAQVLAELDAERVAAG
jgi:phage recombination protein Bet